uniref:F-box domain-containing protein n=1 Tax=Caenorhabditis tropicalis TaxID=1561998 RepID=A0A1I7TAG0_9PELO
MMNSKPLTYNCLESVIKHLDLNKRLQLKARCSSVRELVSKLPLEIDTLDFSDKHLVVNGTEYLIGVIQKWKTDQIPNYAKFELEKGGSFINLDELGDGYLENVYLMPGDIDLRKNRYRYILMLGSSIVMKKVIRNIERAGKMIEEYKRELEEHRSLWGTTIFTFDQLENQISFLPYVPLLMSACKEYQALLAQKKLVLDIYREKKELQQLINIRDNIRPEFRVQLTMSFILGVRSCPIKIKTLIVAHESVIRAPIGLKLKIEELKIVGQIDLDRFEDIFNQLKPILDESSFPLRSLEFPLKTVDDFNHEIVTTAEKLFVQGKRESRNVLEAYANLPNRRVITSFYNSEPEYFLELVENWKEAGRTIGTRYSFIVKESFPETVLELLKKDAISKSEVFDIRDTFKKHIFEWVVVPLNDVSNLKVSRTAPDELSFEVIELFPE